MPELATHRSHLDFQLSLNYISNLYFCWKMRNITLHCSEIYLSLFHDTPLPEPWFVINSELCSKFHTFHTIIRHAIPVQLKAKDVIICGTIFGDNNLCKATKAPTKLLDFKHILQRENVTHSVIPNT